MSRHWQDRLETLFREQAQRPLRRSERRQLRKLLGRQYDREWRIAGNQDHNQTRGSMGAIKLFGPRARGRRLAVDDYLGLEILGNYKVKGTIFE